MVYKRSIEGEKRRVEALQKAMKKHRGIPLSKERKEQISKCCQGINKGKKNGMFGKHSWSYGLKKENDERVRAGAEKKKGTITSPATIFKIGHAPTFIHTDKQREEYTIRMRGENNPNWNDGSSFEPYGLEFNSKLKNQIRERDDYVCQECFKHEIELGASLSIHHIDFDKQNNQESNLISLCISCHGKTQKNREMWTEYYIEKIKLKI